MNADSLEALKQACLDPGNLALVEALLPFREPLDEETTRSVIAAMWKIRGSCDRAEVVMILKPLLPESMESALGEHICELHDDEYMWDELIRRLAVKVPDSLLPRVLELARSTVDDSDRAYVLFCLLPRIPGLFDEVIESTRRADPATCSFLLTKLTEIDPGLLDEALAAIRRNPEEIERKSMRAELAERFGLDSEALSTG